MAARPKKEEMIAKLAELGVEAPPRATNPELWALLQEAEAAAKAEPEAEADAPAPLAVKTVSCKGYHALNVRLGPSKSAPVVGELFHGDEVEIVSSDNGWAKIDDGRFCMERYLV